MNIAQLKKATPAADYEKFPEHKKQLIEELIKFQSEFGGKSVIADLYALGREGKLFSRDMKKIKRKGCLVEVDYMVERNFSWESVGNWYEFLPKETEERNAAWKVWMAKTKEKQELELETGKAFTNAMNSISKTAKVTAKEKKAEAKPSAIDFDELKKSEIQKILSENNVPEDEYVSMNIKDLREFATKTFAK